MINMTNGMLLPAYKELLRRFGPGAMTRIVVVYTVEGVMSAYDLCVKVVKRSTNKMVCTLVDVCAFEGAPLPPENMTGSELHIVPRVGLPAQVRMQLPG